MERSDGVAGSQGVLSGELSPIGCSTYSTHHQLGFIASVECVTTTNIEVMNEKEDRAIGVGDGAYVVPSLIYGKNEVGPNVKKVGHVVDNGNKLTLVQQLPPDVGIAPAFDGDHVGMMNWAGEPGVYGVLLEEREHSGSRVDAEVVEALEHLDMGVVPEKYADVHDGRVV